MKNGLEIIGILLRWRMNNAEPQLDNNQGSRDVTVVEWKGKKRENFLIKKTEGIIGPAS